MIYHFLKLSEIKTIRLYLHFFSVIIRPNLSKEKVQQIQNVKSDKDYKKKHYIKMAPFTTQCACSYLSLHHFRFV